MRPVSNCIKVFPRRVLSLLLCSALVVIAGGNLKTVRETKLAGLRPGIDTIDAAYKRYREGFRDHAFDNSWRDGCNHVELVVDAEATGLIREVRVETEIGIANNDCTQGSYSREVRSRFGSSHNLVYRDRCERIQQIYGAPSSESSSEDDQNRLKTYVYSYPAEGKTPPLNWEVTCATTKDGEYSRVYVMKLSVVGK